MAAEYSGADASQPGIGIWRCPIQDTEGNLGTAEVYLDWKSGSYSQYELTSFT